MSICHLTFFHNFGSEMILQSAFELCQQLEWENAILKFDMFQELGYRSKDSLSFDTRILAS